LETENKLSKPKISIEKSIQKAVDNAIRKYTSSKNDKNKANIPMKSVKSIFNSVRN